ncbi:MAG: hypothetical protein FJY07_10680 [Bacteroidetes bacterium]|nr:hypothetical protein [Bacteroidota bacterium]
MSAELNFIDEVFHFKGEWDVPSFCGLKVISKPDKTIVITTELYDSNPGTSVTRFAAQLATELISKFNIRHDRLIFIEHNPDRKSNLEFYQEAFDIVEFDWDGVRFTNPKWKRITKEEAGEIAGIS